MFDSTDEQQQGQKIVSTTLSTLPQQQIRHRWNDLIELDIKDPALRLHVARSLDYFEKISVSYRTEGSNVTNALSGQYVLAQLANLKTRFDRDGTTAFLRTRDDVSASSPGKTVMPNGKFIIRQQDVQYEAGNPRTAPYTAVLQVRTDGTRVGALIRLPPDYLKGAHTLGPDGKPIAVSVDQVLIHELTHLAWQEKSEARPQSMTVIFMKAMGGINQNIQFKDNINITRDNPTGYGTLHDKPSAQPRPMSHSGNSPEDFRQNVHDLAGVPVAVASTSEAVTPASGASRYKP